MKNINLKKHLFLVSILLLLLFDGCSKKSTSRPINATVKQYFSYKVGTYWIYMDSLTGKFDSFFVFQNSYTTIPDNLGGYEQETDYITEYSNGVFITSCAWIIYQTTLAYNIGFIPNEDYRYLTEYPFPGTGITDSNYDFDIYKDIDYFSSYSIYGTIYDSITEISHTGISDNYIDIYYINIDFGVVKMIIHHPSDTTLYNLGLIRYHIVH